MATKLFEELIAPFGIANGFSCIPLTLWKRLGRPPKNWRFVRDQVADFFEDKEDAPDGRRKRRRTGGGGGGDPPGPAPSVAAAATMTAPDDGGEELVSPVNGVQQWHPYCASGSRGDCRGVPSDPLIRHLPLSGGRGDIYCQTCWDAYCQEFRELNLKLRGEMYGSE